MRKTLRLLCAALALAVMTTACGNDDGAGVRVLDEGEGGSGSGSASGSGSGSGSASGVSSGPAGPLGGYEPASDVAAHAKVTLDVCAVNAGLEQGDFEAAAAAYAEGGNSLKGDGGARTLKGFASSPLDEPSWQAYAEHFGSDTWLDDYVTDALEGTGRFAGASDDQRKQGVGKGVQNGVMVAWVLHELDAARAKIEAGETDPAGGAPHNVDEGWAFYHGENPDCAPYATADKRGADFGRGHAVNEGMLAAFGAARDAAIAGDADAYAQAEAEIRRLLTVTYVQAVEKYTAKAGGGADDAAKQQAEGYAFYRVIAPQIAEASPEAAAALDEALGAEEPPTQEEADAAIEALRAAYGDLGVTAEDIGTLQ